MRLLLNNFECHLGSSSVYSVSLWLNHLFSGESYVGFGDEMAAWKVRLLRFHRSQQQRNLNQRGYGLDERILKTNRQSAEACSMRAPYVEVFELELFGASELADILLL